MPCWPYSLARALYQYSKCFAQLQVNTSFECCHSGEACLLALQTSTQWPQCDNGVDEAANSDEKQWNNNNKGNQDNHITRLAVDNHTAVIQSKYRWK